MAGKCGNGAFEPELLDLDMGDGRGDDAAMAHRECFGGVGAGLDAGGQEDAGAVEHLPGQRDRVLALAVELVAALEVDQPGGETGLRGGVDQAAGRKLERTQPELVDGGGARIDDLVKRARRGDRVVAGHRAEGGAFGIDPDPGDAALLAQQHRAGGALDDDDDVVVGAGAHPGGVEDGAEQQQFGAGEVLPHLDLALRDVGDEDGVARGSEQQQPGEQQQPLRVHSGVTVKISSGR